jgi:5-methylcytosine-specific restriction endonuclease McrA
MARRSRFERTRRTSSLLDSGSSREWRRLRLWILARDLWTCGYCAVLLTPVKGLANSATVDHRLARWEGGSDSPDNLVACCADCQKRGAAFFKRESSRDASVRPISLPRPITGDYTRTRAETDR